MTDSSFDAERKAVKKAASAAESLAKALKTADKAATDLDARAFDALEALEEARKSLAQLATLSDVLAPLAPQVEARLTQARQAAERGRARVVGALDETLRGAGLRLEGRLPQLKCGPLTLEIDGATLSIWYGPKLERLDQIGLDPKKAGDRVLELLGELDGAPLDEPAFLAGLESAWRAAVARVGGAAGDKAPIVRVLAEMAVEQQSERWRQDPGKARFAPYSRVSFSHDLGRLATRRLGDSELMLTVATRDQTKKAADHLWVGGTHYAFLSFRRV